MSTYLHQLPTELVLEICKYLKSPDIEKMPQDLVLSRLEYSFKLKNPDFYDQIVVPIKSKMFFPGFWWNDLIKYFPMIDIFFIFKLVKYFLRNDIDYSINHISSLKIVIRFILATLKFPDLFDLHTYLLGFRLAIINLYSDNAFMLNLNDLYDKIGRLENTGSFSPPLVEKRTNNTERINNVILGIIKTLDLIHA